MKKNNLLLIMMAIAFSFQANAQRGIKIAYIDMDYILKNIPEYQQANQQLESKVQKWKSEIELMMSEVDDMKQNLENERALLTKELIEEREEEITFEEKKVLDYQNERFGAQGDLMVQKRQLVQPVQDQVFNAVQEIGLKREYDFIFENSADALMLFSADRHDISDQILSMIERTARKTDNKNRANEVAETDDKYKSVEGAKKDAAEEAKRERERQIKVNEREALLEDRQAKRDSARAARQAAYDERRRKLLEDRERRRDSIENARNR
ncbi:OmpH family outer membrane protein [Mesonia ostreae]|uniref:OmpH family outer membrane protein n=1 Tax=Mesonia ostreae TaxID=861110 RepID=A0ABU2KFJ5_9FLAO|nr:OmpH family outer membrane protein [Mesonia ostreae]MDT0293481.1 OmpH family outer membrane protein [Mesonia ostreae]